LEMAFFYLNCWRGIIPDLSCFKKINQYSLSVFKLQIFPFFIAFISFLNLFWLL
jgi:hypothetical protein